MSPSNYINYFIDPKAWGSVDAFATTNYGDYAEPGRALRDAGAQGRVAELQRLVRTPRSPRTSTRRAASRTTGKRAEYIIAAQKIITEQLVWIPLVAGNNVVIMNKSVTGAPATFSYMFGPWAAYLGGTGK